MADPQDSKEPSPEMKRAVSRRGFLTGELKTAGTKAISQLPSFGGLLRALVRETAEQRDERLVVNLWQLLMGRKPEPHESRTHLDLVKGSATPDEKGDALVDILWALCQTVEFENLGRSDVTLLRGLYLLAVEREPTEEERNAALAVIRDSMDMARRTCLEAGEEDEAARVPPDEAARAARVAALEGLFTGLLRGGESVLRKSARPAGRRSIFG